MKKDDIFVSERLQYRGIQLRDTEWIVKWRSDMDIIRYFRNPVTITKEQHCTWFQNYLENQQRIDYLICILANQDPIGTVGINILSFEKSECEISYMIGEKEYQKKGFAAEAVMSLMMHVNAIMGFKRFIAEIHVKNRDSIRLVRKLGFTLETYNQGFCKMLYVI